MASSGAPGDAAAAAAAAAAPANGGATGPPPLFGMAGGSGSGALGLGAGDLDLDDIFSDSFFEAEHNQPGSLNMVPAPRGGTRSAAAAAASAAAYDDFDDDEDIDDAYDGGGGGGGGEAAKKRKRPAPARARKMTQQQKVERRERNREHAKRSRVRKKFLLESLQQSVNALQRENEKLRGAIQHHMGAQAAGLLAQVQQSPQSLIASTPAEATRILDDPDYSLVKALQTAQQNFVITDPSLPDNPIVFASSGFLTLTGYTLEQVLGRNCRFLQGPETDPGAVAKIRKAIEDGNDASVCLLNYRIDGTTFWNQFFVAPLRDGNGGVVNYVGVQCKVSDEFARAASKDEGQGNLPVPSMLGGGGGGGGGGAPMMEVSQVRSMLGGGAPGPPGGGGGGGGNPV